MMKEMVWVLLFIGVYVLLQAYILPKMGISTWMRNACQVADKDKKMAEEHIDPDKIIKWI